MRIIAGTARSLPLKTPEGMDTRPTTDRIKETLFNMIQAEIPDCVFYDFYAGSGGIGIEALSRGARHAYFVENGKQALECIKKNLNLNEKDLWPLVYKKASEYLKDGKAPDKAHAKLFRDFRKNNNYNYSKRKICTNFSFFILF